MKKVNMHIILDRSGSMSTIRNDMLGGLNQFIAEQKKALAGRQVSMNFYRFDDKYEEVFKDKSLWLCDEFVPEDFVPRGSTALNDAIGKTLNSVSINPNDKTIFIIITDGEENASIEYTSTQLQKLIKEKTSANCQFVYLGANQDAFKEAEKLGIMRNSSLTYKATSAGTRSMYDSLTSSVISYVSNDSKTSLDIK